MSEYKKDELVPSYNCAFHYPAGNAVSKGKNGQQKQISHSNFKSTHMMEPKNVIGILLFNIFFLH